MKNFSLYAKYYNLIYENKNYNSESKYIDEIIKELNPKCVNLCDLGCGTGSYSFAFEKLGYKVEGIDLSSNMIKLANQKKEELKSNIKFHVSNMSELNYIKKFDVIIAIFDVVSYLNKDSELINLFKSVKKNLTKNGIFIFDYWYGPGVLTELPEIRYKKFENKKLKIFRISNPTLNYSNNIVDVNFDIFITNKDTNKIKYFNELHKMRYFFENEIINMINSVFSNPDIDFKNWDLDQMKTNPWHQICIIKL